MARRTAQTDHVGGPASAHRDRESDSIWSRVRAAVTTLKGGVITVGAIATSIAAVAALIPRQEPVVVRITSLTVSPSLVPLADFRQVGGNFAASTHGHRVTLRPVAALTSAALGGAIVAGPTPTDPTSTTTDGTDGTEPTTTPTDPASTTPSTPTSATTAEPGRASEAPAVPRTYLRKVLRRVGAQYRVDPQAESDGPMTLFVRANSRGSEGRRLPANAATERALGVLSHVRSRPVGNGGKRDSLGVVVRVNVDLTHGEGRTVGISWEIIDATDGEPQSLSKAWLREFAALELHADDDPDSAFFKLWVPLPKKPGDYMISVIARADSDEPPLVEKSSERVVH